jgi:hypothetical protein
MAAPDRQEKPYTHRSEQNLQNWSFDEVYKVLATIPVAEYNNALYRLQVDSSGSLKTAESNNNKTERYDYSSSTTIYVGTADIGTTDSSNGWKIVKYDLTSPSAASGKVATDVSWDNRTTGSYA